MTLTYMKFYKHQESCVRVHISNDLVEIVSRNTSYISTRSVISSGKNDISDMVLAANFTLGNNVPHLVKKQNVRNKRDIGGKFK